MRKDAKEDDALFRHSSVEEYKDYVALMQKEVGTKGTVTFGTASVHRCEVRRSINKYEVDHVVRLAALARRKKLHNDLRITRDTLHSSGGTTDCFLIQMLDQICTLTQYDISKSFPKSTPAVCLVACVHISPKLVVEGIPELVALRSELAKINALSHSSNTNIDVGRRGLGKALLACGIKQWKNGKRRSLADMKREFRKVQHKGKENSVAWAKQSRKMLEAEMRRMGGNPLPYKNGCRTRRTVVAMRRWIAMNK